MDAFRLLLTALCLPLCAAAAHAEPKPAGGLAIAAVVGEEAVSSYDVENRIRFIMATTRLSNTPDVMARIRPQVIRSLIDEKLQLQEATNNKVMIADNEVGEAIKTIEKQRGMPEGEITRMLRANNVPKETFGEQIRAQLAWNKLLVRKIRPTIKISDEEVQLAQKNFSAPVIKQELQIALLNLPVDKPQREGEMRKLADKLAGEIRGGASFEEVSRQFSSGAAPSGGKVESFWVRPAQLDPSIAAALANAKAGTVTQPLRTPAGFTIVKVYNTRALEDGQAKETEVQLKEILLKLKETASNKEAQALLSIGEEVAKHPGSCEEKGIAGMENLEDFDIEVNYSRTRISELPPAVRIIAENLQPGEISSPFASEQGIRLYMLCDRRETTVAPIDKERVYAMLMQEKMELESQKYLRNLRRDVFIEVRN